MKTRLVIPAVRNRLFAFPEIPIPDLPAGRQARFACENDRIRQAEASFGKLDPRD